MCGKSKKTTVSRAIAREYRQACNRYDSLDSYLDSEELEELDKRIDDLAVAYFEARAEERETLLRHKTQLQI